MNATTLQAPFSSQPSPECLKIISKVAFQPLHNIASEASLKTRKLFNGWTLANQYKIQEAGKYYKNESFWVIFKHSRPFQILSTNSFFSNLNLTGYNPYDQVSLFFLSFSKCILPIWLNYTTLSEIVSNKNKVLSHR